MDKIMLLFGTPPAGYEYLQYIFAGMAMLLIIRGCMDMLIDLLSLIDKI